MADEDVIREAYNRVRSQTTDLYLALLKLRDRVPNSTFKRDLKVSIENIRDEIDRLEERIPR